MKKSNASTLPSHLTKIAAPVPLGFARSALFTVGRIQLGTTRTAFKVPMSMPPKAGASLAHTGPVLGQHHALAWQAVIHIMTDANAVDGKPLALDADDLLQVMGGEGKDSQQRARARRWLADLANSWIDYKTSTHDYHGPLLLLEARIKGKPFTVQMPPGLAAVLSNEILRNDLGGKAGLGLNSLAMWLHDYIASHLRPPAYSVDMLRQWSGSGQGLVHFRYSLRKALDLLAATMPNPDRKAEERGKPERVPALGPLVLDWRIDRADRLHIAKAATSVAILGAPHQEPAEKPETAREAAVRQAREQRARGTL